MRKALFVALLVAGAGLVAAWAYYHRYAPAQAGYPNLAAGQTVSRADVVDRHVYSTMQDLIASAPPFDRMRFGTGTKSYAWRTRWVLGTIYYAADGTQYAIYDVDSSGFTGSAAAVGVLDRGKFTPFRFQGNGEENNDITFVPHAGPVVTVKRSNDAPPTSYALSPSGAYPYDPRRGSLAHSRDLPDPLTDRIALTCSGPRGVPVPRAEIDRATEGLSEIPGVGITCYRFAGLDLIDISYHNDTGVTFRLASGRLVPFVRGFAYFRTPRYLVFWITERGSDPLYQDYLEVLAH